MDFVSGTRIGKYTILEKLGEGAQGAVFAAQDYLHRRVALKLLDGARASAEERSRFVQEAKLIGKVEHPGIVIVYDSGEIQDNLGRFDKLIYIAMQRLQGDTLATYISLHKGGLDPSVACELAWQMAEALGAAHAEQVIHRDLKPNNVFEVPDKATYFQIRTKILDFGLGKHLGASRAVVDTHVAAIGGTPMYMSPEQWSSIAKVDHRTDIYALGCILYEMLTARAPFPGRTLDDLKRHHLHTPPPVPDVDTAGNDVCDLVCAMLAKQPEQRVQTMDHVVNVLDKARRRKSKARIAVRPTDQPPPADSLVAPTVAPTVTPTVVGPAPPPTPQPPRNVVRPSEQQQLVVEALQPPLPAPPLQDDTLPGAPPQALGTQPTTSSEEELVEA